MKTTFTRNQGHAVDFPRQGVRRGPTRLEKTLPYTGAPTDTMTPTMSAATLCLLERLDVPTHAVKHRATVLAPAETADKLAAAREEFERVANLDAGPEDSDFAKDSVKAQLPLSEWREGYLAHELTASFQGSRQVGAMQSQRCFSAVREGSAFEERMVMSLDGDTMERTIAVLYPNGSMVILQDIGNLADPQGSSRTYWTILGTQGEKSNRAKSESTDG